MKKYLLILIGLIVFLPAMSFAAIDTNIGYGSKGQNVSVLQNFLIGKGFLSAGSSGNFYGLTQKAVAAYQSSVGISPTGFVGPLTRQKINNEIELTTSDNTHAVQTQNDRHVPTTSVNAQNNATLYSTPSDSPQNQIDLLQQKLSSLLKQQQEQSTNSSITQTGSAVSPEYITEILPNIGPITYLSTISPTEKAKLFADTEKLAKEAASNGTLTFTPPPIPTNDAEKMAVANSIQYMLRTCPENPKLIFQANKGSNPSSVVFFASYRVDCVIDPNMTWSFSDGNPADTKSGTLGDGTWMFGRANSSAVYNTAYYYFSGTYSGINSFTLTVGTTTVIAVPYHRDE